MENDARVNEILAALNHEKTVVRVTAERAFLAVLDGSCRTPIAAHAWYDGDASLHFHGLVAKPDGSEVHEVTRQGPAGMIPAESMGRDAGHELKGKIGPDFLVTASIENSPTTAPTKTD